MTDEAALLGTWALDPEDEEARQRFGDTVMEFHPDGSLDYVIRGADTDQIIILRYRVEGGELVTNQPSAAREERTRFILSDGRLILDYGGYLARYLRRHPA